MLENVKAWGLGQKAKICFPPARGAYFSIKCGQNPILEGYGARGRAPGEGGAASRFLAIFAFFLNFNFLSIFIGLRPHFVHLGALRARFLRVPGRSGEGLGAPKALFLDVFSHFG